MTATTTKTTGTSKTIRELKGLRLPTKSKAAELSRCGRCSHRCSHRCCHRCCRSR